MKKRTILVITIPIVFVAIGYLLKHSQQQKKVDGVDISHHNVVSNWDKVKVDFIYAKATEGKSHRDSKYAKFRRNAMKRDIPFGAYHFLSTDVSAKQQFINFKNVVPKGSTTLIPMLDIERYADRTTLQNLVGEWIKECHDYYGVYSILYFSPQFLYVMLIGTPNINKCHFWIGDVNTSFIPFMSGKIVQFKIDRIDGFEGGIDCNYLNGSLDELKMSK